MKIRVVHIVTRLDFGGAQQNTLYTASHLDPSRFETTVICGSGGILDDDARKLAQDAANPFDLQFLPELVHPVRPLRDIIALLQLFRRLRSLKPEIVHTHSSKAGILGRIAAWAARVPVIIHTYHGFGFHDYQNPLVRRFYAGLERACCRMSTKIVFVSEENRRYGERYGLIRDGQSELIRSGIKLNQFPAPIEDKAKKKAALGCRMHKPMVVSIGNLKPQKNPHGFFEVAVRCLEATPEASFVFIGDGEARPRLEAQAIARGLMNKIIFLGWRRDSAEILAAADLFVMTSLWEGLPRALVEAMKTGLCSVCYATDGVRDVIRDGETGFLIDPGNEAAMAEKIVELLKDPSIAQRVGKRAASSIGSEFDIDEMVRRQERLYFRLLAR